MLFCKLATTLEFLPTGTIVSDRLPDRSISVTVGKLIAPLPPARRVPIRGLVRLCTMAPVSLLLLDRLPIVIADLWVIY